MSSQIPMGVLLASGSPIDVDASIVIQMAILAIAFFILRSLVFKPVMGLFDAREAAMEGSRKAATEMDKDADAIRDRFESELKRVRAAGNDQRDQARTQTQKLARELTEASRKENAATVASAKARLDGEAKQARDKAKAEVAGLAKQIAERLLGRSMS
jgi:F-type H+-transporting ATPase subunit b